MLRKNGMWLCLATTAAVTLALVGCNEPNGSPSSDKSTATTVASSTGHADVVTSAVSPYTPRKNVVSLTSCNLERVDGVTFGTQPVKRPLGQAHSFSGWIAAPQLDKPAYHLRFDDKQTNRYFQAPVHPSIARQDVTAIAGNEALSPDSGFKLDLAAGALAAGTYHVYLVAVTADAVYSCDNGRQVTLGT